MRKMKKRVIKLTIILVLVFMLMPFLAVLAIADPVEGPTIIQVDIYRHCLETDDMLVVVQYFVWYTDVVADLPDETINQSFLGRLMNGGEITNVAPHSFYLKGYQYGIFSIYLSAAEAVGLWEDPLIVEFNGNPLLTWPGAPPTTSTAVLNWHSTTTAQATEILLSNDIVSIANQLSNHWGIALTDSVAGGTVLSSYGEQYFTNAIPNLHTMSPDIFSGAVEAFVYEPEVYEQSGRDRLIARIDGSPPGLALVGLATWLTIPLVVVKGVIWLIVIGLIGYFIGLATKKMGIALFSILVMIPCGTYIGMLSLTFTLVFALLCIIALAFAVFYQRSSG